MCSEECGLPPTKPTFCTTVILRASKKEKFQKGTSVSAAGLEPQVVGSGPPGDVCCFCVSPRSRQSGSGSSPLSLSPVGSQLHLQDFTTMLERCSTLGVLPT